MSWWPWLFPNSAKRRAKRVLRKSAKEALRETTIIMKRRQPIGDLCIWIVSAADGCTKTVLPRLDDNPSACGGQPEFLEVYIYYEFLYFYLHLMNREAHANLGSDKVSLIQHEVTLIIAPTAIDTFCSHWPTEYKSRLEREFYNKLNNAEVEYANCKGGLVAEDGSLDKNTLCSQLAMNILRIAGYSTQTVRPVDILRAANLIQATVLKTLRKTNLGDVVKKGWAAIAAEEERVGRIAADDEQIALAASAADAATKTLNGLAWYLQGDYAPALRLWLPLAEQGHADAQFFLAGMYAEGRGVPHDYALAASWARKASDQGHADAQAKLGLLHSKGYDGLPRDETEAARLYKLSADQGNVAAQCNLGVLYVQGRGGLPKDDREAARLFKLAATQGNATAQGYLGVLYAQGRGGLPKDDREAARLYKLAADQGNASAQCNLGGLYAQGRGGLPMDEREAARLYRLAADQGNAAALGALQKIGIRG
jgi:TPR repeat protein